MNATRIIASTTGVLTGISGINHGFFEAIQGNHPTNGFLINAVGAGNSWTVWKNGAEGAFTIIPNFLFAGVLTIIAGALLIIWSAFFIHKKWGSSIFLVIAFLLFIFGGGVAQLPFIVLTWLLAMRINTPLKWWKKTIPENTRIKIARTWLWLLIVSCFMILVALEIAIFGYFPYVTDLNALQLIDWSILVAGSVVLLCAVVAGFAYDSTHNQITAQKAK